MKVDESFWLFILQYYKSEPIIANTCILGVVFAPIFAMALYHLRAMKKMQLKDKKNIRNYEREIAKK